MRMDRQSGTPPLVRDWHAWDSTFAGRISFLPALFSALSAVDAVVAIRCRGAHPVKHHLGDAGVLLHAGRQRHHELGDRRCWRRRRPAGIRHTSRRKPPGASALAGTSEESGYIAREHRYIRQRMALLMPRATFLPASSTQANASPVLPMNFQMIAWDTRGLFVSNGDQSTASPPPFSRLFSADRLGGRPVP